MKKIKRKNKFKKYIYRLITFILITIDILAIIQVISFSTATFNTIPKSNKQTEEKSNNETTSQETPKNNIQEDNSITPEIKQSIPEEIPHNPSYTLETMPHTYQLEIPVILQYPELPTGCEITALTILLNYRNLDIDKCILAKNYLDYTYSTSLSFEDAFIGSPFNNDGYGCLAPVIKKTADKYLTSINSTYQAYDVTGTNLKNLLVEIANNNPVMVWVSISLVNINYPIRWYTNLLA